MSTEIGALFCELARRALQRLTGLEFETEVPLLVGSPPKSHKFDLATADRKVVGESKAFTWTAGNNIPSAKITTVKEALQYLHALPSGTKTFVVMRRDLRPSNGEPLADYFARLHGHWLGATALLELDAESGVIRLVRGAPM